MTWNKYVSPGTSVGRTAGIPRVCVTCQTISFTRLAGEMLAIERGDYLSVFTDSDARRIGLSKAEPNSEGACRVCFRGKSKMAFIAVKCLMRSVGYDADGSSFYELYRDGDMCVIDIDKPIATGTKRGGAK